jgi:hypothetical protein
MGPLAWVNAEPCLHFFPCFQKEEVLDTFNLTFFRHAVSATQLVARARADRRLVRGGERSDDQHAPHPADQEGRPQRGLHLSGHQQQSEHSGIDLA